MAETISLEDLPESISEICIELTKTTYDARQKAVQAGAEEFVRVIGNVSPRNSGEFAASWEIKDKYPNRRYVGNTKTVSGGGKVNIPLLNILNKNAKGFEGFIGKTFDEHQQQIYNAMKSELEKNL